MQKIEKLYNKGISHFTQKQYTDARKCFASALKLLPNDPQLAKAMAITLANLADFNEAKSYYEMAIRYTKGEPELDLLDGLAFLLHHVGELQGSSKVYREIVRRDPSFVKGWFMLSDIYFSTFEIGKAANCFNQILKLRPMDGGALQGLSKAYHAMCLWDEAEETDRKLVEITEQLIKNNQDIPIDQHSAFLFEKNATFIKKVAVSQANTVKRYFQGFKIETKKRTNQYGRLRIGYLSSALSRHATAHLLQDYFKNHDTSKFEIFVFAGKLNLPCKMFDKIQADVEHLYDVSTKSDPEIAQFIRNQDLDVLVDLDGIIKDSKRGVLYFKPAPIQITWLGTPATMGSPWIDYILSDDVISPKKYAEHYTEQILCMPDCYQFNSFTAMDIKPTNRMDWNIPKDKFVFASFNVSRKIDRESFDAWCEILKRVDGSVLWMLIDNEETEATLLEALKDNNIDPSRLIPANRVDLETHMSRLHNADLMLDCFICGAHTTASEALYCELPIITKIGEAFHSRVAASILTAAGLDELITGSTNEFIDKAVEIASNPDTLSKMKKHLQENKNTLPLFDQKKWMKNFESVLKSIVTQKGNN